MRCKGIAVVIALLALLTAVVSADDETDSERAKPMKRALSGIPLENEVLLEATGLEAEALWAALAEGSTIAELIEAKEGDVESVIAEMAARMTDDINANVSAFLEGLDESVSEALEAEHSRRGPWGRRWLRMPHVFRYAGVSDAILEATGLDAAGLRAALAEGSTLAELIEGNDGDPTDVAAEIVAQITEAVQASAAERIEGLDERLGELFDSDLSERWRRGRRGRMKPRFFFGFWGEYGAPAAEEPAA